jgi:energy-coupling factor transport system permease protein
VVRVSVPVPFGDFVPGDSPLHRLEPRAKLGITAAFSIALFLLDGWPGMLGAAAVVAVAVAISRVPLRIIARGLSAVGLIMAFTVLANALRWGPEPNVLASVGPLAVSGPGLARGLFFAVRIVLLVLGTSLVTLTTSPVALTDALATLMRPLERVRFPAADAAMMLSIALRFIPTTAEEAEKVIVAQAARGARFSQGGPIARARAYVPVLVPLFVNLFRRADDLAIAMESRCYRGTGRTRLRESVMAPSDWVTLAAGVAVFVVLAVYL